MGKLTVEELARRIDPEIWEMDGPIPTRSAVEAFHFRRQASVEKARECLRQSSALSPTEADQP